MATRKAISKTCYRGTSSRQAKPSVLSSERLPCFNGLGKTVAEHCEKGMKVLVHGRIHYTKWIDSMGNDRYGCEIIAEKVDLPRAVRSRPRAKTPSWSTATTRSRSKNGVSPSGPAGVTRRVQSISRGNVTKVEGLGRIFDTNLGGWCVTVPVAYWFHRSSCASGRIKCCLSPSSINGHCSSSIKFRRVHVEIVDERLDLLGIKHAGMLFVGDVDPL
jgi:single-stranded DNA-binding protein